MEDHRKSRTQSTNHSDKEIVELTQEMELPDQNGGDIIDLTHSVDSPDAPPIEVEAVPAPPATDAEMPIGDPTPETPAETERPRTIEKEVDAAFETVQAEPAQETGEEVPDDQLFDKLSDITEMVDNAVRENEAPQAMETHEAEIQMPEPDRLDEVEIPVPEPDRSDEAQTPALEPDRPDESQTLALEPDSLDEAQTLALEPDSLDEDSLAADAAVFEAAMEGESPQEEILELTDIAEPEEAEIEATNDLLDDDEIIELTEIVDPAELAQISIAESEEAEIEATADLLDDDEIIELTEIVDPAELEQIPITETEDEEILELNDIAAPAEMEVAPEEIPSDTVDDLDHAEPSIDEPDMALPDEAPASQELERRETAPAESAEIADMFMEEMALDVSASEEKAPSTLEQVVGAPLTEITDPDDEQEQVIQLSDVLGQTDREERLPIEKIKVGAEEDLAAHPISLEREDTANALGLDLEKQSSEEEKLLHDRQIEDAVEHLLQTKFAETINRLIADAVEKAVAREMEAIKRAMQEGDDAKA